MKAAILGTTGYTGLILLRLLGDHPGITSLLPVSSSVAGVPVTEIDRRLAPDLLDKCRVEGGKMLTVEEAAAVKPDVVFAALPHLKSARICEPFFGKSVVIDLSADFRIKDPKVFEKAYGQPPPRPDLLDEAVYGLCETDPGSIKKADLIANPGCYPTAALLPLIPLLQKGVIRGKAHITALSGISGAGKKVKENLLFCERTENCGPYSPGKTHRHCWEIQQEIGRNLPDPPAADMETEALFTPHLVPLKRGMSVTTSVTLTGGIAAGDVEYILAAAYRDTPFVEVRSGSLPQTADVRGSNRCDIGWHTEGDTLLLFSCIDNLMKGASGQAVQNMNIRFGFDETAGLPLHGEL